MGNGNSKTSIRITQLNEQHSRGFKYTIDAWCDNRALANSSVARETPDNTGDYTGTASCPKKHKSRLLHKSIERTTRQWNGAYADESFAGLTMLYSPDNVQDIDIE